MHWSMMSWRSMENLPNAEQELRIHSMNGVAFTSYSRFPFLSDNLLPPFSFDKALRRRRLSVSSATHFLGVNFEQLMID